MAEKTGFAKDMEKALKVAREVQERLEKTMHVPEERLGEHIDVPQIDINGRAIE